jgi:hypothetical protein
VSRRRNQTYVPHLDRNHRQFADGYRRSLDLHYGDLELIRERSSLLNLLQSVNRPEGKRFSARPDPAVWPLPEPGAWGCVSEQAQLSA